MIPRRLSVRYEPRSVDLHFETGGGTESGVTGQPPDGWVKGAGLYGDYIWNLGPGGSLYVPCYDGQRCTKVWGNASGWVLYMWGDTGLNADNFPELFSYGIEHSLRIRCRTSPTASNGATKFRLKLAVTGEATLYSGYTQYTGYRIDQGGDYTATYMGSWHLQETSAATWTGSTAISAGIEKLSGSFSQLFDDFQMLINEVEIPVTRRDKVDTTLKENRDMTVSGRQLRTFSGEERRWRLPLDHLPDSSWIPIERWLSNGNLLWLQDVDSVVYPVTFEAKASPVGGLTRPSIDRRSGVLDLVTAYRYPVHGMSYETGLP